MTLIVGLICKDGLVIGAEEEESAGVAAKRQVDKLTLLTSPKWAVCIGGAGDAALCEKAAKQIGQSLRLEDELTKEKLEDSVESALALIYSKYVDTDPHAEGISLIVGASCSEGLCLLSTARRTAQFQSNFAYAGIAADVAIYFLDRLHYFDDDWEHCVKTAAFTLWQAKESSQFCGGSTHLVVLHSAPLPRWRLLGDECLLELDNEVINMNFMEKTAEEIKLIRMVPVSNYSGYSDEHNPTATLRKNVDLDFDDEEGF